MDNQNNWESMVIEFNEPLKENITVPVRFQALKDLAIKEIKTSCGCLGALYNKSTRILEATFKTGSVPIHLSTQGYYITHKNIIITYEDGSSQVLSFSAKIAKDGVSI